MALRPGDPLPLVRVALAALASGREDEGLRLLRRSAEEAAGDASGRVAQAVLDAEVSRVAMARPDDAAVRAWLRVATRLRSSRETEMAIRWTHPDLGVELLSRADGETAFTAVGESPAALGVRAWTPDTALEGTHLVVRAPVGIQGARVAEARVQLLAPGEAGTRLVERVVRFDRAHRAFGFVVRDGALVEEPVAPAQVPARDDRDAGVGLRASKRDHPVIVRSGERRSPGDGEEAESQSISSSTGGRRAGRRASP